MESKGFDCVEMKRRGSELVRQRTEGMTREQELAYWRERTAEMKRRREDAKRRGRKAG